MEIEEEKRARLEDDIATTQLMLIKGVVNLGVVWSLKPILESWQLCLSLKLDVHSTTERNIDHESLSASLILLYIYLITYTL